MWYTIDYIPDITERYPDGFNPPSEGYGFDVEDYYYADKQNKEEADKQKEED